MNSFFAPWKPSSVLSFSLPLTHLETMPAALNVRGCGLQPPCATFEGREAGARVCVCAVWAQRHVSGPGMWGLVGAEGRCRVLCREAPFPSSPAHAHCEASEAQQVCGVRNHIWAPGPAPAFCGVNLPVRQHPLCSMGRIGPSSLRVVVRIE